MYAAMLGTELAKKAVFKRNFMRDWKKILGKDHAIEKLEDCDFTEIQKWYKEEKNGRSTEVIKQDEQFYGWAVVDGQRQRIQNYKVEAPGLFVGRGKNPDNGKVKRRLRPSDFTINIGEGVAIPPSKVPCETWKQVVHRSSVQWLASWKDPISGKTKYVVLALKRDFEKFEKARHLKRLIRWIRATYMVAMESDEILKRQIAVATYLIDVLAFRAGNEKGADEANTVGCCTLKVKHVVPIPPNTLKFNFLGKDSIEYDNEVDVDPLVYAAIKNFREGKEAGEDLFDELDTVKLNAYFQQLMDGLTAKVFRTCTACITFEETLLGESMNGVESDIDKVKVYNKANKKIAELCNHRRTCQDGRATQLLLMTSKRNYLDPRISVAWCKRQAVPIEKVFNGQLLEKFQWAMDADSNFRF